MKRIAIIDGDLGGNVSSLAAARAAREWQRQEAALERGIQDALRESLSIRGMAIKLAPLRVSHMPAVSRGSGRGGAAVSSFPSRSFWDALPADTEPAA